MDDKPKTRKEKAKNIARRAMWLFMALLFIVTGLGVGIVYFWQATHQKDNSQQTSQQNQVTKLKGTKLPNFTPVAHIDKLQAIDTKPGTGAVVKPGDTVTAIYTGAVASSGVIFDSNADIGQPAQFSLSQVIAGWTDGLPGMKVGGERRLLIPAAAGYGANPPAGSPIPPNADLVFDITLLATKSGQ